MRLGDLVETSQGVGETTGRLEKIRRLADLLKRLEPAEIRIGVAFLSGELRQGRIGVGYAALQNASPGAAADSPTLTLLEVDDTFGRIAAMSGAGSSGERARLLHDLFFRATRVEHQFLFRLVLGELRQGALEGLMAEAVARAASVPARDVRRALMFSGDLGAVAHAALTEGTGGLSPFGIRLFRPIKPMLAQTADSVAEALARFGSAAFEFKLDGARVQVHKDGEEVRIFTRRLNDVTAAVPDIVQMVQTLPARQIILDGEALALGANGKPQPFQVTMRRFGRKLDVARMREEIPLTTCFFDCLYLDGEDWIDRATEDRFRALSDSMPAKEAIDAGHEGLMAKALDAPYQAGGRGQSWLKVKPAHTLDLVVLAAEWGHGRRRGWLSNLHLGARDPSSGQFVMLGKTFKGMTDEMLQWQTERLQEIEISRDRWAVYVRPELVVEVAFNEIQASPQYPGGLALRFARVKGYRPDKSPEEADTMESVRAIYRARVGGVSEE
jgi:DNA ligase-1